MTSLTPTYDAFIAKLSRFRNKEKRLALTKGLFLLAALAFSAYLVTASLESFFSFKSPFRLGLLIIFFAIFILGFLLWALRPLLSILLHPKNPTLIEIAVKVGDLYQGVDDRLANALEVFRKHESNRENYSIELIDASLARIAGELRDEEFADKIDRTAMQKAFRWAGCIAGVNLLAWLLFAPSLNSAAKRLFHPLQDFSIRSTLNFHVQPGDKTILKGQDLSIQVWVSDASIRSIDLNIKSFGNAETIHLQKASDDTFRHTIPTLKDSIQYFAAAGNTKSPVFRISVVELPMMRTMQVKISPPRYARLEPYLLEENVGDVSALRGSLIEISGECNKSLSSGKVAFANGDTLPLAIAGSKVSASFHLSKDDTYTVGLKDKQGRGSDNPIEYHLNVIPDQFPFVNIPVPGKDLDLGEDMMIPITLEAQDDYGISQIRLAYQILSGEEGEVDSARFAFQALEGLNYGAEQLRFGFNWDLSKTNMLPNDYLLYFAEAYDNDSVSGPKRARSKIYRARFPSIYDLYQEVAQNQTDATEQLKDIYDKSQQLNKEVSDLSLEMKRNTNLNWQQQQQVDAALKQHQEMAEQLDKMSEKLEQMVDKMEKNNLVSQETLQKYQELQQLFKEIMTPELQEAMKKVADAMQNLDQALIQKAMDELKLSEEDFKKSIERTISLLKRLKIEQKLDQALRMTRDLAEREKNLTEQADQRSEEKGKLLDEQNQIKEDTKALSDLLNELKRDMAEEPGTPQEQIEQAQAKMDSSRLEQQLEQMKDKLQKGDKSAMQQQSAHIQQAFDKISQSLQQAKESMSGEAQKKAMQALRQSARDILELSKRQESLMGSTQEMPSNSSKSPQAAEQQQDLASALSRTMDNIFDASKESFYINPSIAQHVGQAAAEMERALQEMENQNNPGAAARQGQAMAELNEAVKDIQGSMQSMMQGGASGMSMQQFMQQMQGLASAQQGINQQTMGLGMGGQMSLAQQAAIARLAAGQESVRKSMEALAQEAGNLSEILGSLDKIVDDMKEVEKDFGDNNVTRKTIERQNRILSRMLDSQKSMREREYSQKRKAETAKEYVTFSPDELPADLGERRSRLQQDLLRAKKEGYTRDYLELIRKYYEALMKNEPQENR
jgi:hypothetical protein